jgi:hypothetical protein
MQEVGGKTMRIADDAGEDGLKMERAEVGGRGNWGQKDEAAADIDTIVRRWAGREEVGVVEIDASSVVETGNRAEAGSRP